MLKRISTLPGPLPENTVCVPIGRAGFPAPFPHGLEYSPPCRGKIGRASCRERV